MKRAQRYYVSSASKWQRILTLLAACTFYAQLAFCQLWSDIPINFDYAPRCFYSDSTNGLLYIGGNFEQINGVPVYGIISYNGTNWDTLRSDFFTFPVTKILRYDSKLCVAGFDGLMIFDGQNIQRIPCDGQIRTLYEYEGQLLVGGLFRGIGTDSLFTLAAWDGTTWSDFKGTQQYFQGLSASISDIKEYRGELYIAGSIYDNGNLNEIMKWNGNTWTDVGGGIHAGSSAWVRDMEVYHDELYVAGYFYEQNGGPGNNIAKWNGSNWERLGEGLGIGQALDLQVFEDKLYVSGMFDNASGIPASYIAYWQGNEWCTFGGEFDNVTAAMAIYQDSLYVAGGFRNINGTPIKYLAKWTGGNHVDSCISVPTGLNTQIGFEPISLYPNPSNHSFSLSNLPPKITSCNLRIYDIAGREVMPIRKYTSGEIDVSALAAGMYFVEVQFGKQRQSLKLVKE